MTSRRLGPATLALACGAMLVAGPARGAPARDPGPRANRWLSTRRSAVPPQAAARAPAPAPAPAPATAPAFTEADFNACHKVPAGKRLVPVNLKPDTDVDHLIVWLSSVTCKSFVYAGATTAHNRNVTIVAPAVVTPTEAYQLVLDALNSVGLTLQPAGGFFQIIESQRAKSKAIPLYGYDGRRLDYKRPRPGG